MKLLPFDQRKGQTWYFSNTRKPKLLSRQVTSNEGLLRGMIEFCGVRMMMLRTPIISITKMSDHKPVSASFNIKTKKNMIKFIKMLSEV
ncbi:hypothetical protein O9G_000400 [Rozella allomycis CSF55]|uniref:DNase I-like protein n=1 Tax=Rozella allomycis (strain CSF55) TaxID=988480 RepID=A0A075AU17_ROZAC|nr:hypothetical protein O9G_000400 [Rozella allomycis CSF55]|eukprot:EPZ33625.1 hypothetical protein O9G_000400 [Rozella allomycis CSF55]